jgi:hypothetical protein
LEWGQECDLTADDILQPATPHKPTEAERCTDAIRDLLAGKSVETEELNKTLTAMGYSKRTIERARQTAGVRPKRVGYGAEGVWHVHLPDPDAGRDDLPDWTATIGRHRPPTS